MSWASFFLNPAVVWVLIPMSIIIAKASTTIYRQYCRHQERIAMINNGIHPDENSGPTYYS